MSYYVPIEREQRRAMLAEHGIDLDKLYAHIPEELRFQLRELDHLSDKGASEMELLRYFEGAAAMNKAASQYDNYLGAGFYDHYSPSAVHQIISRQEFLTSYTPYQQEISQGTLQATFEWQSYICRLTGMDVANSSMYDGASACAESALMAFRIKRKAQKVWISAGLNPHCIETLQTYLDAADLAYEIGELNEKGSAAGTYPSEEGYAAFIVQTPNYYGVVEDLDALVAAAGKADALSIAGCDPVALSILRTPGEAGVDIVYGEAQPLGASLNYGGPALGYMCCRDKDVRRMPGRICGQTVDEDGKTAYVLTLQAREQHIRRERATSNICTAQALLATAAAIHMALMGGKGLREAACQSADKARYLCEGLVATGLFSLKYNSPFFREFALQAKDGVCLKTLNKALLDEQIIGGLVLPENVWLLAVTEKKSKADLDRFVEAVRRLAGKEAK